MNRWLTLVVCMAVAVATAQSDVVNKVEQEVYYNPEVKAEYPGGLREFYSYVMNNLTLPEVTEDINLKIYVSFTINTNGVLQDIKVLRDPGFGVNQEVVNVVKLSPAWKPALHKGIPVKSTQTLPFVISVKSAHEEENSAEVRKAERDVTVNNRVAITKAEFPGGYEALKKEFFKKFVVPEISRDINVKFALVFMIDEEGKMVDINCIDDPGHGIGAKAVAALQLVNKKWQPATKGGTAVKSPGTFALGLSIEGGEGPKKLKHNVMRDLGPTSSQYRPR